jgi:hypothetical protein
MKLSDLKLADFQNAASQVDLSGTLTRLAIITLLPFVACMVILFARPDLNTKFVVDSFATALILLAGGVALVAGLQRFEEREAGDQSTAGRSLFDAGAVVLASLVVVALIYLVSQIGR